MYADPTNKHDSDYEDNSDAKSLVYRYVRMIQIIWIYMFMILDLFMTLDHSKSCQQKL